MFVSSKEQRTSLILVREGRRGKEEEHGAQLQQKQIQEKSLASRKFLMKDKILDRTANAMWNSGYPATQMLLSHIIRGSKWAKKSQLAVLCGASALEIVEELI